MTVVYLDPYKDDPYGKLKGDKSDCWFKVTFDEARLYPIDTGYILAGYFTSYAGVVRSFKASEPLAPGLCALPIHSKEYEVREKDSDGNWKSIKYQPSIAEEALCKWIRNSPDTWTVNNMGIRGDISFPPNAQLKTFDVPALNNFLRETINVTAAILSGKLPEYKLPENNAQRKGWGGSKGVSLEEKLEFIKKEMISSIAASGFDTDNSLAVLTDQIILEHADSERFLEIYFDMLMAIVR